MSCGNADNAESRAAPENLTLRRAASAFHCILQRVPHAAHAVRPRSAGSA